MKNFNLIGKNTSNSLSPYIHNFVFNQIFAEYHHFINQISPFSDNMVFAYTNGVECYVGTKSDYDLGNNSGYETSPMGASLLYQPRLPLSLDSEAKIKDGLKNLLNSLKNQ